MEELSLYQVLILNQHMNENKQEHILRNLYLLQGIWLILLFMTHDLSSTIQVSIQTETINNRCYGLSCMSCNNDYFVKHVAAILMLAEC